MQDILCVCVLFPYSLSNGAASGGSSFEYFIALFSVRRLWNPVANDQKNGSFFSFPFGIYQGIFQCKEEEEEQLVRLSVRFKWEKAPLADKFIMVGIVG